MDVIISFTYAAYGVKNIYSNSFSHNDGNLVHKLHNSTNQSSNKNEKPFLKERILILV